MTPPQWQFAGPRRPIEELYDCQADPQNLKNLADSPKHKPALSRLRKEHLRHITDSQDLGFIPEHERLSQTKNSTPWEVARRSDSWPEETLLEIKGLDKILNGHEFKLIASNNPSIRYHGALLASQRKHELSVQTQSILMSAVKSDPSPSVRIQAADALARLTPHTTPIPDLISALEHKDLTVVMLAARTVELLGEKAIAAVPSMEKTLARAYEIRPADLSPVIVASGDQDIAMFIGFSAKAFLDKHG